MIPAWGAALLLGWLAGGGDETLSYGEILRRMVDLDWLATTPAQGERARLFSSYQRASASGPSVPEDWFRNQDAGQYLRTVERDGEVLHVLAEATGPGIITRIWSANPRGRFGLQIDGETVLRMGMQKLLGGEHPDFPEPICGTRGKGFNCYLPLPFQESFTLASTAPGLYYQVEVLQLPEGSRVPSFQLGLVQAHRAEVQALCERLRAASRFDADPGPVRALAARSEQALLRVTEAGVLRRLRVGFPAPPTVDQLSDLRLCIRGHEPGLPGPVLWVDVPLGDFFGGGAAETGAGCRYPMPTQGGLEVIVRNEGDAAVELACAAEFEPGPVEHLPLRLHATWTLWQDLPTRPRQDVTLLTARGPGRLVGSSLRLFNPVRDWWGEGDAKIYVDGESFPGFFGTGTEDHYGYAWASTEGFRHAFHALVPPGGPKHYGSTWMQRGRALDQIPFHQSLRDDLEIWHWQDCQVDLATTVFWYGPAAESSGSVLPSADRRRPRSIPPFPTFHVEGALEGESLAVDRCSGGRVHARETFDLEPRISGGAHLLWDQSQAGDTLVLSVPVAAAGSYEVRARFSIAMGEIEVQCEEQVLGVLHRDLPTGGENLLGRLALPAGTARLTFRNLDKLSESHSQFMLGIDYIKLVPDTEE